MFQAAEHSPDAIPHNNAEENLNLKAAQSAVKNVGVFFRK